jgi:hypothetical protein
MTCIFHIYTSNKNTYIVCTIDNGRLTVSTNGQYYIQIDAADLQELDYGQLRWKMTYEILHNQQPNHVLEGTEYGGVDTYLVSEIINN